MPSPPTRDIEREGSGLTTMSLLIGLRCYDA